MKNALTTIVLLSSLQSFSQTTDSATYFYQKGVEEKTAQRYLAASKNFDKAIKFNARYTAAYIDNGYANLEMRKTDAAITNFTNANELEPENNVAINELMNLYFSYRQYAKAVTYAQKCKDCANADKVIAISYFQQEDYAKAEKALLPLITKTPNDAEVMYTLGRTYLEMEMEKKAITYYEKAVLLDTSKNVWLHELGLLYYNNNNFKSAIIAFNKAAANGFPQSNDFNENLGYSYIYAGEFEKGEKILLDIMAKKPGNKDILRDIAQAYYDQKLYDKSLEFCQKLMELDMKDAKALYQAGMCFQKKGQKDKGQAMCDKAIELDPSLNKMKHQQSMMGAGL
ncbi:tetratricopeptide repeat protein [Ferruginibacter sp. SUN106]|uniref:tetratricopeptide repeat protein n=1 Tax=Ferruginibacter sp. SUN106 TaxID=2978348 RepID=UPI003D366E32